MLLLTRLFLVSQAAYRKSYDFKVVISIRPLLASNKIIIILFKIIIIIKIGKNGNVYLKESSQSFVFCCGL